MKFIAKILGTLFLCSLFFFSCTTIPQVSRVDAGTQTDLSGYWNDTDLRIVCESLIRQCLDSPRVANFNMTQRRVPVILVGNFRNESDEHIDTAIISQTMAIAILNSGRAEFVAGGNTRSDLREERQDQQYNSSDATASALGNETGADFMLTGSVRTIIDRAGNTSTRTYFVTAELLNIETNASLWMGQNSEIKKVIRQPRNRL